MEDFAFKRDPTKQATVEYAVGPLSRGGIVRELTDLARDGWRFVAWINEWPNGRPDSIRRAIFIRPLPTSEGGDSGT